MLWVLYSLLSAFGLATADAFTKRANKVDDYILMLSRFLFGIPLVLLILLFVPIPQLSKTFWIALIVMIPFETLGWVLYTKAVKIAPISLVLPFLALTPVFLIFTSFIILGEIPTILGFYGILLIVFGAYVLNITDFKKGFLEPFSSIFRQRGCVYMIIVAFLFSITGSISKILVEESSPLLMSAIYLPVMAIAFFIIALFFARGKMTQLKTNFTSLLPIGIFYALMIIFHNFAIRLVIVPYMISIKRTSSIFSVLYGHFWFKEKNIRRRLAGALIMVVGAAVIILS
jgi:drug/metabolite transporter (DMT)-like permease